MANKSNTPSTEPEAQTPDLPVDAGISPPIDTPRDVANAADLTNGVPDLTPTPVDPVVAEEVKKKSAKPVEAVVLTDGYDYVVRDPEDPKTVLDRRLAILGDKVLVSPAEFKRGQQIGYLGTSDDYARALLNSDAGDRGLMTDDALGAMSAFQVLAYLTNHPDEIDRVELLEEHRAEPRDEILKAVSTVRDFQAS